MTGPITPMLPLWTAASPRLPLLVRRGRFWGGALARGCIGNDCGCRGTAPRIVDCGSRNQHQSDDRCDPAHAARISPGLATVRSARLVHSASLIPLRQRATLGYVPAGAWAR